MSAGAQPCDALTLAELVDAYLHVLRNERGSSEHTLRAYERELREFALYIQAQSGPPEPSKASSIPRFAPT